MKPRAATRRLPTILLALAIASAAFAWWGLFTRAGNSTFDEMAGIIPYAAAMCGVVLALAALLLWLLARRAP